MVIEIPEWKDWRIVGQDHDWQVQKLGKSKEGAEWRTSNYFTSIEYAISFVYEKTLRTSKRKAEAIGDAVDECCRVKDNLLKAVRKAVKEVS